MKLLTIKYTLDLDLDKKSLIFAFFILKIF